MEQYKKESIEYLLFYICIVKMIAYHKGGEIL